MLIYRCIQVFDVNFQVVYGLIGDQDWNLTMIYGISCIGTGLVVLLLPAATTYWLMATLCALFGFFVSANYSLMTVMLVSYLGLDKLTQAYGLLMMIQGIANLGGPPLAGNTSFILFCRFLLKKKVQLYMK